MMKLLLLAASLGGQVFVGLKHYRHVLASRFHLAREQIERHLKDTLAMRALNVIREVAIKVAVSAARAIEVHAHRRALPLDKSGWLRNIVVVAKRFVGHGIISAILLPQTACAVIEEQMPLMDRAMTRAAEVGACIKGICDLPFNNCRVRPGVCHP